jgi:hypothetical protein
MEVWLRNISIILISTIIFSITVLSLTDTNILTSPERSSPSDWVKENQILIHKDKVILNILNPTWAKFTDTNSMDPFIDETSHAIEILPQSADQVNVGDVIAYKTIYGSIIHRVIEKGEDSKGVYYIVQGDNNKTRDPFKVRFGDIEGVVVAVIY